MALDRDLAVAFVRALGRPLGRGWEVTAATGVRGLRLLGETRAFSEFLFTEANARSFEVLRQNVAGEPRARAVLADGASGVDGAPFGYVDVDPYGSPLGFLPAAFAASGAGSVLGVTATDMPVLAGAQAAACLRRYGARPVRGRLGPEGAVRIVLMVLAREARRAGRSMRPLLAYVGGHHVRAYVELGTAGSADPPVGELRRDAWDGPPLGGDGPWGPFWLGPLVDPQLAARAEVPPTAARPRELARLLERLREDAALSVPFYFEPNRLASVLGLAEPVSLDALVEALRTRGFRAGRTHVRPEGLRTDAPRAIVEAVAAELARAR